MLMCLSAGHLLTVAPSIHELKISHANGHTVVYATDVMNWCRLTAGEEIFVYEDDGEAWDPWENRSDLIRWDLPPPEELEASMIRSGNFAATRPRAQYSSDDEDDDDYGDHDHDFDDGEAMQAIAQSMYPGAAQAGLEWGDIMELMEHDMIFGEDHTPI